jgi:cyclase
MLYKILKTFGPAFIGPRLVLLRSKGRTSFFIAALFLPCQSFGQHKDSEYQLKEISKGIYVSQRPEPVGQVVEGNFVFIVNEKNVVVVDATLSPRRARRAIAELKHITDKPVKYLINTHFHGDHTFGNQVYLEQYKQLGIIASKPTAEVMQRRVKTFSNFLKNDSIFNQRRNAATEKIKLLEQVDALKHKKLIDNLKQYRDFDIYTLREDYQEVKITPPTLIFDNELVLKEGDREIRVLHLGHGDTDGDIWVYLPVEKILITGDAVVHPIPYGYTSKPVEWLKTLEKAADLDFEIMITGHGDVQHSKEYLLQLIDLLRSFIIRIEALSKTKNTKEAIKNAVGVAEIETKFTNNDPYRSYYFQEYFKTPVMNTLIEYFLNEKK